MANFNRVILLGNLTRDPELRYVPSGTAVASFGLATNRTYIAQNGEKKEEVCFVTVIVWGKQAESCSQYLSKGSPALVEGRLTSRSWEQDGVKRSTIEVRAERVQFLGRKGASGGETKEAPVEEESQEDSSKQEGVTATEEAPF